MPWTKKRHDIDFNTKSFYLYLKVWTWTWQVEVSIYSSYRGVTFHSTPFRFQLHLYRSA